MRSVATQGLDEVRGRGEESGGDKARYTLIAREHITHTLLATGYFSAEDFDSLGIPPAHVNVCTSWIGHFSKRKVMEPISWRYSSKPSRKGGKVWTYKITQKGRDELPALLEDTRAELRTLVGNSSGIGGSSSVAAAAVSGEAPGADTLPGALPGGSAHTSAPGSSDQPLVGVSAGRPTPQGEEGLEEPQKQAGVHSGESGANQLGSGAGVENPQGPPGERSRPVGASTAPPEPLSLLPDPDPEAWAA